MPYKKSDPEQVAIHDDVTQTTIIGIIASNNNPVKAAEDIMAMLRRRGYTPHIKTFNQLWDGTHC